MTGQNIITDDWRVVGSRDEFFQGVRAQRELLAREEIVASIKARQEKRMARMRTAGNADKKIAMPRKLQQLEVNHADRRHAAQKRRIRRAAEKEAEIAARTAEARAEEFAYRIARRQQQQQQQQGNLGKGAGAGASYASGDAAQLETLERLLRKQIRRTSLTTETSRRYSYTVKLPGAAAGSDSRRPALPTTTAFPSGGGHSSDGEGWDDPLIASAKGVLDLVNVQPEHLHAALKSEQRALQARLEAMGIELPSLPTHGKGNKSAARTKSGGRKPKGTKRQQQHKGRSQQSPAPSTGSSRLSKKAAAKQQQQHDQKQARPSKVKSAHDASGADGVDGVDTAKDADYGANEGGAVDIVVARAKLQREKQDWLESGAAKSPLVAQGWKSESWLADAARELARSIDPQRTGFMLHAELMQLLTSRALGLGLDDALVGEMSIEVEPNGEANFTGDDIHINYEEVLARLPSTLSAFAFADNRVLKNHWCTVYSPTLNCDLRYNRATQATEILPRRSLMGEDGAAVNTSETLHAGGGGGGEEKLKEGAVGRAVSKAMKDAARDVVDVPGMMEEEDFYLVLQSSGLGLRLLAADVERIQDELPPGEDGTVPWQELCDEMEETILDAYSTTADSQGAFLTQGAVAAAWCRLWSPEDGIFFFNKRTGTASIARPADFGYGPGLGDHDIEDFLFGLFSSAGQQKQQDLHDPASEATTNSDGSMLREDLFWELLEQPAPTGPGIFGDAAFLFLTKFDRIVDGWVPWRDFVVLFRGLAVQVSAEDDDAQAAGEDWLELQTGNGVWFYFDKVSGASVRSAAAAE